MKKQGDQGNFLELERRGTPAMTITKMTSTRFRRGDKVKLLISVSLNSVDNYARQPFWKGTQGRVVGQANNGNIVACFEKENWEVEEADLAPIKKKARSRA